MASAHMPEDFLDTIGHHHPYAVPGTPYVIIWKKCREPSPAMLRLWRRDRLSIAAHVSSTVSDTFVPPYFMRRRHRLLKILRRRSDIPG
jgi:hypothetical protein